MAEIGFELNDIAPGGQYADLYQRVAIIHKHKELGLLYGFRDGKYTIKIPYELIPSYTWMNTHKDNLKWVGVPFYAIAPASFKTQVIPAWHSKSGTHLDENEVEQPNTFESEGMIARENNDSTKVLIALGELNASQLTSFDAIVVGNPNVDGYTEKDVRDVIINDVTWTN